MPCNQCAPGGFTVDAVALLGIVFGNEYAVRATGWQADASVWKLPEVFLDLLEVAGGAPVLATAVLLGLERFLGALARLAGKIFQSS